VVRAALAASLSVAFAWLCRFEDPIYALIAAVIVTDLSPSRTSKLGLQRVVATILGATCGATLSQVLLPSAWAIALGILVAMVLTHMARVPDGARVSGYICGIVMLAHGTRPWSYAFNRLIETVLGIAVAWLLSFVPKLVQVDEIGSSGDGADSLGAARGTAVDRIPESREKQERQILDRLLSARKQGG
jgi:uncharacterized membrane protein YgaE (UPF0421/DUF939 family)